MKTGIYNSDWFFYICVIGFIAYGIYYLYNAIKLVVNNEKARREFLENHGREEIKKEENWLPWVIAEAVALVYCVYSVFTIPAEKEQAEWFRLAFGVVGIIMLGQMMQNLVKRRILVGEKGFVYESDYVPYQSIVSMNPKRRAIITLVDVLCLKNKKYTMPGKCGQLLHDEYRNYKRAKKAHKGKH